MEKCRGCLSTEHPMHIIFSIFDQGYTLADIIQITLNVDVVKDDSLPQFLCVNCTSTVVDFFNFKATFLKNEEIMRMENGNLYEKEEVVEDVKVEESVEEEQEESIQLVIEDDDDETYLSPDPVINKKRFRCNVCGATTKRKSDLLDHMETHSNKKKHICPYCQKAFQRRTVLVKHKRIHTHPRQAVCELCGKAFNDKGTLKTHKMLIHEKRRDFYCDQCGRTFPLKATLEKHIRRHDPNRPKNFVCSICKAAYNDKFSLKRHIMNIHNDSPLLQCECGTMHLSGEDFKNCPCSNYMTKQEDISIKD